MSAKSKRHHENQAAESRLLGHSKIEQRALQIARDEGRELITTEDRARAREELLAPNDNPGAPETAPELGVANLTAWDEPPGASGRRVPRVEPEDENGVGQVLIENGLRAPATERKS